MGMWKDIETAPKDGQMLLLRLGISYYVTGLYGDLGWMDNEGNALAPTDWMDCPDEPDEFL